ncbi:hypothetical protein EVAR_47204_1 [Eumeta japonica]|uniref:Uncharacterized protein n=1 Tax=Eumeta variegata TaxID=151549 RepID=A0A4C1XW24_EUMVA|nr:hypothetical protein EVAR_47204_1 [Eumeta japonica]
MRTLGAPPRGHELTAHRPKSIVSSLYLPVPSKRTNLRGAPEEECHIKYRDLFTGPSYLLLVTPLNKTEPTTAVPFGIAISIFQFCRIRSVSRGSADQSCDNRSLDDTLHEALSFLEKDDNVEPQQVEPPDPAVLSDEDQGSFVNNLTGRQLGVRCEVMLAGKSKDRVRRLKATTSKTMKSYSEPQLRPSSNQTSRNRGRGLSQSRNGGRRGGRSHDPDLDSTTDVITNQRKKIQRVAKIKAAAFIGTRVNDKGVHGARPCIGILYAGSVPAD